MSNKRIDDERRAQIADLARRGFGTKQIADKLGVCTRSVQRIRDEHGCAVRKAPALTGSEILRATELLEDGASYAEVGRTIGRNPGNLARAIPGYKFDAQQAATVAALARRMYRLEREIA